MPDIRSTNDPGRSPATISTPPPSHGTFVPRARTRRPSSPPPRRGEPGPMTPSGQTYPIAEHSFLFWGIYLGAVMVMTIGLLGLFIYNVHRDGQTTRRDA